MKRFLLSVFILLSAFVFKASAQQYVLSGKITDAKGNPISYVSVYIRNSTYGTTTNEEGIYKFNISPGTYNLVYRFVGYKERVEKVTINDQAERRNIQLEDEIYQLNTVTVKSGPDTAANQIMRKVIAKRAYYLNEVKSYSCAIYVKGVQKLIKAPKSLLKSGVSKVLDLDSNGRGILYQSETLSSFNYERPNKVKEITISSRAAGITPTFSYNKASDLQANFYNNIFMVEGLSANGFVSPIADNAFSYYRYKLIGQTVTNGRTIDKIQLSARGTGDHAFEGDIYIVEGDWRIYSVNLRLTNKTNKLNLVDTMTISQQYVPVVDSTWMPASIQYDYSGNVFGFKFQGYYIGVYNNYKFNITQPAGFFNGEILRIDTAANLKDAGYWFKNRPVPLTAQETRDYQKKDSIARLQKTKPYLDSLQKSKNTVLLIPYTVFGFTITSRDNKDSLYVYPFNQTLFYNTVEGIGLNLKVRYSTTSDDFKTLSISPAVRYGFANKLLSANVHSSYTYDPFHAGQFFLNFGNDVLDLNNVGTRSLFFNTLSTLLSSNNYVKYYRSEYADFGFQR
ncbi:MAG: carboxypeptidase-like regulatory domain-containing protein, partial [Mucilaginibacter sp.]|nr:carboxypeptidase-like regulatory domain-containing protein [Mucilaginibacter sp.]